MNTARISDISAHTAYPLDVSDYPANLSVFNPQPDRQVREDKGSYIPDLQSDTDRDTDPQAYAAAADHAKQLYAAQRLVGEALNLAGLLLASLVDEGDSRAMQFDTSARVIEEKLSKAYNRIDKHDARHTKLFLAYIDLKRKSGGAEPS